MSECSKCHDSAATLINELCDVCWYGAEPDVIEVGFDVDEQIFYYVGRIKDPKVTKANIKIKSNVFEGMESSYRLGDEHLDIDTEKIFLEFGTVGTTTRLNNDDSISDLEQSWEIDGLESGLNVIYVRVCHPRTDESEDIIPPSTRDKYVIEFPIAVQIGEKHTISQEDRLPMLDNSLVLRKHIPPGIDPSDLSCKSVSFWGFTKEAISQQANRQISDDDWISICNYLEMTLARVYENTAWDELQNAIAEYPVEDEDENEYEEGGETEDYASLYVPRVVYSFTPELDSTPHYIYLNRADIDDVTDSQWNHFQNWITIRQQKYLFGYLPILLKNALESSELDSSENVSASTGNSLLRTRGVVCHALHPERTTKFIKETLGVGDDVDLRAEVMLLVNGEKGVVTLCVEGVGWHRDRKGKLPINYWIGNQVNGYIDVTSEQLVPLIADTKMDLADFVLIGGDGQEKNLEIWQKYAEGYPQDKVSLVNRIMNA